MPCTDCGHPLYIERDTKQFSCPNCSHLEFEDPDVIKQKIEEKREILSKENIINLIKSYKKDQLVLLFVQELNKVAHELYKNRKMNIREWVYLNTIIEYILEEDGFGDETFDTTEELPEELDSVVSAFSALNKNLDLVEEEFKYCAPKVVSDKSKLTLAGEYMIFDSEYHVGYFRCAESMMGGSEDSIDYFDVSRESIREEDIMSLSDVESPEDFGRSYFNQILSFVFMMTSEEQSKERYSLNAPDSIDITEVMDFLEYLNEQFTERQHAYLFENPVLTATDPQTVDTCGRRAFGRQGWADLKDEIIVSEENIGAYPLLYELTTKRTINPESFRRPREQDVAFVFYPKFYSLLLRFHMFPMLKNGDNRSGEDVLDEMIRDAGDDFEKNIAEFLQSQGYECYFQSWISQSEKREVDIIAVSDSQTLFIEAKHFRPPMGLYSKSGIRGLNDKFDYEIFKEDNGYYDESPTGKEFDTIIHEWSTSEFSEFSFERLEDSERSDAVWQDSWLENDVYSLVVSNLTPSYVKKRGVRFLTDIELVKFVQDGEDTFYKIPS